MQDMQTAHYDNIRKEFIEGIERRVEIRNKIYKAEEAEQKHEAQMVQVQQQKAYAAEQEAARTTVALVGIIGIVALWYAVHVGIKTIKGVFKK